MVGVGRARSQDSWVPFLKGGFCGQGLGLGPGRVCSAPALGSLGPCVILGNPFPAPWHRFPISDMGVAA